MTTKTTKTRRARPGEARAWLEAYIANFHTAEDINACVLWPFAVNSRGYPCISVKGVSQLVTRVVMERVSGAPLSDAELMCHTCDIPRCVNPWHLYSGDDVTNTADKIERGRQAQGEGNARSRLTADDVRAIRDTATGRYGEIIGFARRYGVSIYTIKAVLTGESWASVA
jgi:hypothetical protein